MKLPSVLYPLVNLDLFLFYTISVMFTVFCKPVYRSYMESCHREGRKSSCLQNLSRQSLYSSDGCQSSGMKNRHTGRYSQSVSCSGTALWVGFCSHCGPRFRGEGAQSAGGLDLVCRRGGPGLIFLASLHSQSTSPKTPIQWLLSSQICAH